MKEFFKTRFFSLEGDRIIWGITVFFCAVSLVAVFSATGGGFLKQLFLILGGLTAMFICSKMNYAILSKWAFWIFAAGIIVLILTVFKGDSHYGARRSLFGYQTLYFVVLCVIIFFSQYLAVAQNHQKINTRSYLLSAFSLIIFISGLLVLANFSTAVILFLTIFILFFVSEVKLKYLLGLGVALSCILILVFFATPNFGRFATAKARVEHTFSSNKNEDFNKQTEAAKAAIATGLFPAGPGKGQYKISHKATDYIYALISEELGSIVGILILIGYVVFFTRVWLIALRVEGPFARFLTVGIGFWICSQALVHIGVSCELLPATGQTLPFISRSGASLMVSGTAIGILLSISKTIPKKEKTSKNYGPIA